MRGWSPPVQAPGRRAAAVLQISPKDVQEILASKPGRVRKNSTTLGTRAGINAAGKASAAEAGRLMNNRGIRFVAAIAGAFLMCGMSSAAVMQISPAIQDPTTGIQYQLLSNGNWTDSQAEAQALGGNLVTIANQEQQDFVFTVF